MIVFLIAVFVFLAGVFTFSILGIFDEVKKYLTTSKSIIIDMDVDEIFNKAVIIAEYLSRQEQLPEEKRKTKAFEQASGIVADVMLQRGLQPKEYNIPALVLYFQHRNGIISIPVDVGTTVPNNGG